MISHSASRADSSTTTAGVVRNEFWMLPSATERSPLGLQPMKPRGWVAPVFESKSRTPPYAPSSRSAPPYSAPSLTPRYRHCGHQIGTAPDLAEQVASYRVTTPVGPKSTSTGSESSIRTTPDCTGSASPLVEPLSRQEYSQCVPMRNDIRSKPGKSGEAEPRAVPPPPLESDNVSTSTDADR